MLNVNPRRVIVALGIVCLTVLVAAFVLALGGRISPGREANTLEAVARYAEDPGAIYDRPVVTLPPTPAPTPTASPAPADPGSAPLRQTPYRIVIDRIGVDAPVGIYGLDASQTPEVPLNAYEVAWYDFSAQPGTGGNAVFAGHVTWSGHAVFYNLNQLSAGDAILLRGDNGTELRYSVAESCLVDPNDPNSLSVMGPTASDTMTIITCDGEFYYTGDPTFRGDYTHRRIVRAQLTSVNPAGEPLSEAAGG